MYMRDSKLYVYRVYCKKNEQIKINKKLQSQKCAKHM